MPPRIESEDLKFVASEFDELKDKGHLRDAGTVFVGCRHISPARQGMHSRHNGLAQSVTALCHTRSMNCR